MSNSIAPGSSADVNVRVTALTTNPNVPVTYKTIILKKNLVNGVNTLTQEMMSATNTKYVVKYDYTLSENITIPSGCILEFDGGSISGGTVNLNYGIIRTPLCKILHNAHIVNVGDGIYHSRWYTDYVDGITDCSAEISNLFSDGNGKTIIIDEGKYKVSLTLTLAPNTVIKGNSYFRTSKSVFYLHDCEGTFINANTGVVIDGIYFDGTNGISDNFSTTLLKFIDCNNDIFNVVISNCTLIGTSCNNAVALNIGQSFLVDVRNCSIGSITNGYATIVNGSSTTISFRKVYFNYCRQILNIVNDTTPIDFTDCVFESSYSIGYISGYASFTNCHVENIGYSINSVYEGMDYLPGSSTDKLDCLLCCNNAIISFRDSLICDVDPNGNLNKIFRLYPDVDAYSSNGVLTFDNCKFSDLHSDKNKILYIKGNNDGQYAAYYKVVINGCDLGTTCNNLIIAIKELKGCANITMTGVGYRSFNLNMDEGKANVFFPRTDTEFSWPFNLPIEKDDTLYLAGEFFQYPTEYYRVKKLKVCFAQEIQVTNLNDVNIISVSDTSKIKVGDNFRIDTGFSSYFYGTITEVNSDNIKLSTNITGSGYLYIFAFRPADDDFGEVYRMLSVSPRWIGCKCVYQNKLYIQNASEWVEI